jgi:hypothetical protein
MPLITLSRPGDWTSVPKKTPPNGGEHDKESESSVKLGLFETGGGGKFDTTAATKPHTLCGQFGRLESPPIRALVFPEIAPFMC